MNKIYIFLVLFMLTTSIFAQSFEIRVVSKGGGSLGVEMRETSGTGTPTTSNFVTDIVFGIKWLTSYNVDLASTITTSYNIQKSGTRSTSGSFHFQAFFANNTPFNFPASWTQDNWVEIMSISNDLTGTGTGTFEICELGFDGTTEPNIGVDLTDYTPTINGSANDVPLPVELSSFSVNAVEGAKAQLQWETSTEVNNYGFEVERSVVVEAVEADVKWEKVAFVEGHGNSNSPKLYSFTDKNLVGGSKFMYRLKQIDIDGTFEYTDAVEVEILPTQYELYQNYPNPFNPSTNIKFSLPEDTKLAINIYNLLGERVATVLNEELKAGFHQVEFNTNSAGYSLSSGVYIYTIESKNFSQVKKMILMK